MIQLNFINIIKTDVGEVFVNGTEGWVLIHGNQAGDLSHYTTNEPVYVMDIDRIAWDMEINLTVCCCYPKSVAEVRGIEPMMADRDEPLHPYINRRLGTISIYTHDEEMVRIRAIAARNKAAKAAQRIANA